MYESRSPDRIRADQASITVTICTGEFDRVGEIMETAAAAGVTQMSTNFRSTKLEELKKQVRDMALQAAKDKLTGSFALAHETNAAQAQYLGMYEAMGAGYEFDARYPELITQVSAGDIQRVARKYFSRPSVLSLVAPAKP